MKHKTFLTLAISGILLILVLTASVVYAIDPYQQYHTPNESLEYNLDINSFAYYNPGIAKNYDYDTVITGSSMSRALLPSYVNEKFECTSVKLSMAEGRGKDYSDLFKVLEKQENWERVIMGLDTFAFTVDKDYSSYEKPLYLYDYNPLNDELYLTNMDGLIESANTLIYTKNGGKTTTMDEYQNYALTAAFSEEQAIEIYRENGPAKQKEDYDSEELRRTITDNLEQNIIPFIENCPEREFLFFFPPYSIIRWGIINNVDETVEAMEIITERLVEYPNVSIFFYQGEEEVITDLNHYMDTLHFDGEVANQIIDYMTVEENKLTADNYEDTINSFSDFVKSHDYSVYLLDSE